MAHVRFTRNLLRFFPRLQEGSFPGADVAELVRELDRQFPKLATYLVDESGALRQHVNIFVGETPIEDRHGLSDPLEEDSRVFIVQALSGG